MPVVGIDAIKDACLAVKSGDLLMTVYQDGDLEGRNAIALACDLVRGKAPAEKMNLIEMKVVNKDTVDEIMAAAFGK